MAGERWIVFMVLASMGGGIYVMSYFVDDESIGKYGERVAEYNAQHHETLMDAALHRAKRVDARGEKASDLGNDPDDAGIVDHLYSENDRVMRARLNDDVELDAARRRRSSGQRIDESEYPYQDAVATKTEGSIEQGIQVEHHGILPLNHTWIANVFDSAEDIGGQEDERTSLDNTKLLANHISGVSSSDSESPEEYDYSEAEESHVNPYEPADFGLGGDQRPVYMSSSDSDGDKKLITFNKGIDFILGLMNSMFSLEGEVSVPLPKLNKTFGRGIMQGLFEADGGFFKNPATIHRTGDVAIVKNGDSVGLEVALGLETLEAGYDHYDFKILRIHQNGTLDISVAENSIKMKISLVYSPHCKVDVNYLELDQLGGIKIDITGLGAFQSMVNMLTKWLTDNFTNDLRLMVNKKLIEKAKKAVAREDICKYFPLSLL